MRRNFPWTENYPVLGPALLIAMMIFVESGCGDAANVDFSSRHTVGEVRSAQDGKNEAVEIMEIDTHCNRGYYASAKEHFGHILVSCVLEPK